MKEKDTRKKRKELEIKLNQQDETTEIIDVDENVDFKAILNIESENSPVGSTLMINRTIQFNFIKPNIKSDIFLRVVVDRPAILNFVIKVVAPRGVKNIESKLDMRALILHEQVEISFVPVLEIDEKDVSVDHKSTIGAPEGNWIEYMGSRAVKPEEIKRIIAASYLES